MKANPFLFLLLALATPGCDPFPKTKSLKIFEHMSKDEAEQARVASDIHALLHAHGFDPGFTMVMTTVKSEESMDGSYNGSKPLSLHVQTFDHEKKIVLNLEIPDDGAPHDDEIKAADQMGKDLESSLAAKGPSAPAPTAP